MTRAGAARRTLVAGLVMAAGLGCGFAHAATSDPVQGREFLPSGGPALFGDGVAWGERQRVSAVSVVTRTSDGQRRRIGELTATSATDRLWLALAGSSRRLALASFDTAICIRCGVTVQTAVYQAVMGGPLTQLAPACSVLSSLREFDVAEDLLAARDSGCRFAVYDLERATEPQFELPADARAPRVAGSHVAWLTGFHDEGTFGSTSDIVVFDLDEHRELYRVAAGDVPGPIYSLDLQSDGKIAIVFRTLAPGHKAFEHVAWASPEEPRLHVLPLPPRLVYQARIAGDEIAFMAGDGDRFSDGVIGIAALDGTSRSIAAPAQGRFGGDDFDFDGRRIAWVQAGCTRALIRTMASNEPPVLGPPRTGCKLELVGRPRLDARGRVRLTLGCTGFDGGCATKRVVLTARAGRDGGVKTTIGVGRTRDYERSFTVTLHRDARRVLVRTGRLRVTATAVIASLTPRSERRSTSFVVRTR
jgi:hypothetical protein